MMRILFGVLLFLGWTAHSQVFNPNKIPWDWQTDLSNTQLDLTEVTVVVKKGAFPVLKNPLFIGKEAGLLTFFEKEPVLVVQLSGEARAYPFNMLTVHEIANDRIGSQDILVTYCPLCNSGMVFSRKINHEGREVVLDFQVSGMLRNSDMIMFDEQTETWWQQLTGEAIAGKYEGVSLEILPSMVLSVSDFFKRFPEGKILSQQTGISGRYGRNPYVGYDNQDGNPYAGFISTDKLTNKLPNMERVVNLTVDGQHKVYSFSSLQYKKAHHDNFQGKEVVVFYKSGTVSVLDAHKIAESKDVGTAVIFSPFVEDTKLTFREKNGYFYDKQTKSKWDISGLCLEGAYAGKTLEIVPHGNHLAFAWLAFYPDSEVY
ncbi:MAG: DUF3179 domain-containing protein [Bacteroidetes bacterium]|nr:DUF3179 domain-containing protein [Bacteroidota bacterium]